MFFWIKQVGGSKNKNEGLENSDDSYFVNSVKTPPITLPTAEPKAEPDAKVANAKDRAREGGNA